MEVNSHFSSTNYFPAEVELMSVLVMLTNSSLSYTSDLRLFCMSILKLEVYWYVGQGCQSINNTDLNTD